ncbi:MAG: nucleotide exchange factor GrpE [Phycisphaerales bacterium]|nr:nucleotide exchange factor GrpE [Phycisphaerales bacterium]
MIPSRRSHPSGPDDPNLGSNAPDPRRRDPDRDAPTDTRDVDETAELIAQLTVERDEAVAARQRALADFRNFQRRADEAEMRALTSGSARVVRSLIPALDHFDLALGQDLSTMSVQQLADGVRMVRDEISKTLETLGVARIEPKPGDDFDPTRHEAMMRQPSKDIPEGHVVATFQSGFAMGDLVLRPAKVSLSGS